MPPDPQPRFAGEAKLIALTDTVFTKSEFDDLEARSIIEYVTGLEGALRAMRSLTPLPREHESYAITVFKQARKALHEEEPADA